SLQGNRLTGPIPKEIGNISTLEEIVLEFNQLSGPIPSGLRTLSSIKRICLTSNNFSGELPETLAELTTLKDFRIGDNHFTGKIPNFIEKWTNLDRLAIQASGMDGPIPSGIALLTNLTDLRISDLNGSQSTFPPLNNMKNLEKLILRSCNIIGELPDFLGTMTTLKVFGIVSCLRNGICSEEFYSFHINCGGKEAFSDQKPGYRYEDDTDSGGPSKFFQSGSNWGFSSTGHFLDDNHTDSYIQSNTSVLRGNNTDLYKDARLSPLSLTYYGYCLRNGNYTVNLHFAEIMFTDDKTYKSLGRRVFDIYIQRKLVRKDFNIEDEAGGVGKGVVVHFRAVVNNRTLEIRLYWAGKGTLNIPDKGVYGPLISAISVVSDAKPPSENGSSISAGTVVGIVVGIACAIFLLLGVLWWKGCLPRKDTMELGTWATLALIFLIENPLFFFGLLLDGTIVAVKQLSSKSKQGNREFVNEIGMISALQHPHLVKLYGCCIEGNQLLLVYEYMENNSLARALFEFLWKRSRCKTENPDVISINYSGYMAPEYAMRGYLTDKADVYSFGIVALEIVSGRSNTTHQKKDDGFFLLDQALVLKSNGKLMELVDPRLESQYDEEEVMTMIDVALLCTNVSSAVRPSMSSVVSMLEGKAVVQEFVLDTSGSSDMMKPQEIQMYQHQHSHGSSKGDSQIQSKPTDGPWAASSTSVSDLYPINLDSQYWENRDTNTLLS
ncbi:hypothetical protein RJ639_005246, partial [Escallonia herrerae]